MSPVRRLASAFVLAFLTIATARADPVSDTDIAALREGARIDEGCLKRNVIDEIGKCRYAATATEKAAPLMLGLWFHMWFSDVALAGLYREKNPALAAKFEQLADAEFPAVWRINAAWGLRCRISAARSGSTARPRWNSALAGCSARNLSLTATLSP